MPNQEILGAEPFKSQSRDKVLNLINNERQALKKRKVLEEFDNRDDIFVTKSNPRLLPEKDDDDISNLIDDSFLGSLPTSEACAEFKRIYAFQNDSTDFFHVYNDRIPKVRIDDSGINLYYTILKLPKKIIMESGVTENLYPSFAKLLKEHRVEEVVYIRSSRRLVSDARDAYEILNIDGTNQGWLVFKIPYVAEKVSPKKHIPKKYMYRMMRTRVKVIDFQ